MRNHNFKIQKITPGMTVICHDRNSFDSMYDVPLTVGEYEFDEFYERDGYWLFNEKERIAYIEGEYNIMRYFEEVK